MNGGEDQILTVAKLDDPARIRKYSEGQKAQGNSAAGVSGPRPVPAIASHPVTRSSLILVDARSGSPNPANRLRRPAPGITLPSINFRALRRRYVL